MVACPFPFSSPFSIFKADGGRKEGRKEGI
jgi:hypothetical protein